MSRTPEEIAKKIVDGAMVIPFAMWTDHTARVFQRAIAQAISTERQRVDVLAEGCRKVMEVSGTSCAHYHFAREALKKAGLEPSGEEIGAALKDLYGDHTTWGKKAGVE